MQVIVKSLLMQYERIGKGKTVLILHGWGDNSKGWLAFQHELAKQYDVIALDLPGFGGSDVPPTTWGLTDYAQIVGDFLSKISVKPYAIVGHSNGGAIAIRALARNVCGAQRLVLLDSAGIRNQYSGRKKIIRFIAKTGKLITLPLPKSVKRRLRKKLYATVGSDMLVAERLQETFKRVVSDDVQKDAAGLQVSTLLVYGEDDLDTPVQYGRILHNLIAGSTLEVVGEGGHFVHLDKPQVVLKMVKDFLQ